MQKFITQNLRLTCTIKTDDPQFGRSLQELLRKHNIPNDRMVIVRTGNKPQTAVTNLVLSSIEEIDKAIQILKNNFPAMTFFVANEPD